MPSPRWLVVTVLEGWSGGSQTLHPRGGQEILDRCRISQIGTAGELANGTGVEPETTYIRFERTGVGLDREFVLFVAESPMAICAALDDCAVPLQPLRGPLRGAVRP